ncbi:type VI secretion system Vgr family protein [Nereida sp. MMG025]|uniref:type VI secretion system Vgr family protein n=1 Tax=Nereida sp. MMG025 TaxID=2909981 RepID=UPI001F00777A|nr:type VI secretion system tip protein TssI/VgrG [Nereida sp. MMG025]MCF6446139.1 type VI secretion system tip protein VgrG [Nereida sp. MMG025]
MNTHFSQQDRQGRLTTAIGAETLVLLRMDGSEELSGDFEWRVEALATEPGLNLHGLLGTHATVEIDHADGTRAFDGIVCEAQARGASENGFRYDLVLRPWLHVADLRRNMRIFHNKTVVQIVEEVLSAYTHLGSPHLDVRLTEDYPVLEYTTQYGDSDADFVRRQLERHGISWSWRHELGSHTLLLTDAEFSLPKVPGNKRPYYGVDGYNQHDEEHFNLWSSAERITTGAVRLTEYNFKIPNASQEVDYIGDATHPSGDIESYVWPGDYLKHDEGRGVVNRRTQAERGQAPRQEAAGDVVSLGAGWRVTLTGDEVPGATGRTFVCLKAQHRFRAQAYGSGDSGNDAQPYDGSYVLMPDDTPYRPERRIVGPRVQGPETAVVVGEGEIDCDEHSRILCRFHWDLEGANTMRVRVSQSWASKGWGGMVIPRIGMEVIIEHLRGDPDKPIVTGCVYNGNNTSPYELPAHKTRSTFKTDTHQGAGFNELRFEDEQGREEIFVHAQKDRNEKTLHNHTNRTDNNYALSVGHNFSEDIEYNREASVGGNVSFFVGHRTSSGPVAASMRKNWEGIGPYGYQLGERGASAKPQGNFTLVTNGSQRFLSDGSTVIETDLSMTLRADQNFQLNAAQTYEASVGSDLSEAVGASRLCTAGDRIVFATGASKLILRSNGQIILSGNEIILRGKSKVSIFTETLKGVGSSLIEFISKRINLN